jgi:phage terminase, large subunit, PBSX family|nr:MAG TPA: terminase large subunit [Caudoviricetes sp.]
MQINYKKLNPLGFHLLKLLQDTAIRLIILFGGSSSGKSYSVAQLILIMTLWDGENTIVMRKVGASISKTIYEDFKVAAKQLGIFSMFKFKDGVRQIVCIPNGAKIDFGGLDDPEKIKGISNYKRVVLDEWSEFDSEDYKQVRKRLRGKEGQQIITTFNPIKETHWIKKEVFDVEKWHDVSMDIEIAGEKIPPELTAVKSIRMNETKFIINPRSKEIEEHAPDTVVIQSTYLNNFWVVGSPDGTYGYYDEQCIADFEKDRINDPDYYNVYALGEWGVIRTGSEFFGSFNRGKHTGECKYNPDLALHVSVDNNVLPYISYTFWQIEYNCGSMMATRPEQRQGIRIRQIDEIAAESPHNTARKSALLVAAKLRERGVDRIYLHGDASTHHANTIDDQKRSFLDLVISTLQSEGIEVIDCVGKQNPSVPMSGEFINAIFDNIIPDIQIIIGENCKISIEDYMSVQKDENGAILKTKVKNKITMQTYEEHGHMCFTPDTPVITLNGTLPISQVKKGDFVLTEKGWQRVYNSLCTIRKSQYFSLTLQGQRLDLTYEHPIFTDRGFVPANQLKDGDIITRYSEGKIWQEKLSYTRASDFIATLIANLKAIGITIADGLGLTANSSRHISTDTFGILPMGKFLRVIVFTILMAITITIHLGISPLCLLMSMRNSILRSMEKAHGVKSGKDLKKHKKKQSNGINQKKGKHGIARMVKIFGKISQWWNILVKFVGKPLRAIRNTLRNFVQTTAKANGEECQVLTMKSAFVRCVGLISLSIDILRRCAVHGNVPLCIGGISDVYDISTTSHTFFANGVLVHNSDTMRYTVTDLVREQFLSFSNRRKRNTYARDGMIHFYNPDTDCKYSREIVYAMPNVNGKFAMVHGKLCGEKWHIVDLMLRETSSTDEIAEILVNANSPQTIIECGPAYFRFVRNLRKDIPNVRAMKEVADIDRRIAATSDFVKNHLLFNETKLSDDIEYSQFMTNLLDYNKDTGESIEASAVLSGFIRFVVKFSFESESKVTADNIAS